MSSDELKTRTEELKESLIIWRNILLPLNNLFQWKHKYHPFIIFGIITFIFSLIFQLNPSVLTLISCIILIIILIDLLVPIGIRMIFKNENWTENEEIEYTILCECIANFQQQIKYKCESALKMRRERPIMYLMIGGILLSFIAVCSQCIDNLLLSYLTTLIVCLIPGIYNQQIITLIHQYIIDFWNNKKIN